jgi:adenylate kinase
VVLDPRTFLGQCVAGTQGPDDVDDWIDRWHEGDSKTELHDYLGMTREEYANFAIAHGALVHIIEIRRMVEKGRTDILQGLAMVTGRAN